MRGQKREREGRGATASGFLPGRCQPITRVQRRIAPGLVSLSLSLSFRPNALFFSVCNIFLFFLGERLPSACVSTRLSFIPPPGELDVKLCLSLPFRSND